MEINMNDITMSKICGLISLSMKAGKLAVGEERAKEAIISDRAYLIIVASDASDNTKKKFSDMAAYRNVPLISIFDRYQFGKLIGKKFSVSAVVTDKGFADSIIRLYEM